MELESGEEIDVVVVTVNRAKWGSTTYRGFDDWFEDDLTDISAWDRQWAEVAALETPDVEVVLAARPALVPALVGDGWTLLGWDVGYLDSSYSHFSLIRNAVIWGKLETLRAFEPQMNAARLAPDIATAIAIGEAYRRAGEAGRDVEQCDAIEAFAIFVRA